MANSFETEVETRETDTLSGLAQHLVYRLPGCDDRTIRYTLREMFRDFCRRSCCLRVRRRFEVSEDGLYPVFASHGGTVRNVTEVRYHGRALKEGREWTAAECGGVFVNPRVTEGFGEERGEPIEIVWIEVPALTSEETPPHFVERYGEAICAGVLARLMSQPNRPWSDPQSAAMEAAKYEQMVNEESQKLYAQSSRGSGRTGDVFDTSFLI